MHAIAGSADYQCYLNSQEYLSSSGSEQLPPVVGAGTGQNAGDHPTATSAFVANYLETEIGHQLVAAAGRQAPRHGDPGRAGDRPRQPDRADLRGDVRDPPDASRARTSATAAASPASRSPGTQVLEHAAVLVRRRAGAVRRHGHARCRRTCPASAPARRTCRATYERHHARVRHGVLHRGRLLQPERGARRRRRRSPSAPRSRRWRRAPPARGGTQGVRRAGRPWRRSCRRERRRSTEPRHWARSRRPSTTTAPTCCSQITTRTPTPYATAKPAVAQRRAAGGSTGHPEGAHRRRAPRPR